MKKILFAMIAMMSGSAYSAETCYSLSFDGNAFSRVEKLCVSEMVANKKFDISLKDTGPNGRIIAVFHYDLVSRGRCVNCNADTYGVAIPSNSMFSPLKIEFDGQIVNGVESGTVKIGEQLYHYKS